MRKLSLGKGLGSLIPKKPLSEPSLLNNEQAAPEGLKFKKESIFNVETERIRPNPNQPRQKFFPDSLKELADSIKEHGIIQPLLVDKIEKETVARLVGTAQIIVDCMDNFPTRHILNEHAVKTELPFVHAGVSGMSGQITFIHTPETPCLYCTFPGSPPPEVFPIVGATAGVIGTLEALEVLKYLTGKGNLLKNRMLFWDGELMNFHEITLQKDLKCTVCGKKD